MRRITISKEYYNYLANHMMYVYHNKLKMIKGYSQDYNSYVERLEFLNGYIKTLEKMLDDAIMTTGEIQPPVVIIGSTAVTGDTSYRIVLPGGGRLSSQRPDTKMLIAGTPEADALLYKQVGESVTADVLDTVEEIQSIIYDADFFYEENAV